MIVAPTETKTIEKRDHWGNETKTPYIVRFDDKMGSRIAAFEVVDRDCNPSWKRYGSGSASLEVRTHRDRLFLGFAVSEHSHEGRGSSKKVHFTMSEEVAAEFYAFLKDKFEA
jgi:hypothetical protein